MRYDFENAADRTDCSAIKINKERIQDALGLNYYPDSISMWIADMDFVCAPPIVEAIVARAQRATFGYTAVDPRYYESLCSWYETRLGMHFRAEETLFSNGTLSALRDIIRALTSEQDGIIIQPPVYYPFANITRECKRRVVENHLKLGDDGRYSIDFEDFEQKCQDPASTLFILCNPHNPIGQIWSREDVERMLAICKANNVTLFSDEVHADIIRQGVEFTSTLKLDSSEGVIVATAVNKTFNLAGLHITNLVIPDPSLRERINAYRGMVHISPIAQAATIAAYSECREWADQMNSVIDENILYMAEFFKTSMPKVRFNPSKGTYLVWVDLREYGLSEKELLTLLADKAHLIVEGGTMFSAAVEGFVRMNVACPKSLLMEALERMKRVLL